MHANNFCKIVYDIIKKRNQREGELKKGLGSRGGDDCEDVADEIRSTSRAVLLGP